MKNEEIIKTLLYFKLSYEAIREIEDAKNLDKKYEIAYKAYTREIEKCADECCLDAECRSVSGVERLLKSIVSEGKVPTNLKAVK